MSCQYAPDHARPSCTVVDDGFLLRYLPGADGIALSVYLYGLMQCQHPERGQDSIAAALHITPEQERDAFVFWQNQGLVEITSLEPLQVLYRDLSLVNTESRSVTGRFTAFNEKVQTIFAPRQVSASMLLRIQDWIDVYGFTEEAALLLVEYCVRKKGKRIGIPYLDAAAQSWAQDQVCTAEDAREHIRLFEEQSGGAAAVLKRLRIRRLPTEDEQTLYAKWTQQWQLEPGAVLAACALMTGIQQPNLKYLDSILDNLCRQGLRTRKAVEEELARQDTGMKLARMVFERAGIERTPDAAQRRKLTAYTQGGMSLEVLLCAAEQVQKVGGGAKTLLDTLKNWQERGITTVAQARQAAPVQANKKEKHNAALDYIQQQYTDEELLSQAVNLEED